MKAGKNTMITSEDITRINELARKSRDGGLTAEELTEQTMLRRRYIDYIKAQVKSQLDMIKIVDDSHPHDCSCGCHHDKDDLS